MLHTTGAQFSPFMSVVVQTLILMYFLTTIPPIRRCLFDVDARFATFSADQTACQLELAGSGLDVMLGH